MGGTVRQRAKSEFATLLAEIHSARFDWQLAGRKRSDRRAAIPPKNGRSAYDPISVIKRRDASWLYQT